MRTHIIAAGLVAVVVAACSGPPAPPAKRPETPPGPPAITVPVGAADMLDARKPHRHDAPHGGALIEIGDRVGHLEFVLDAATGTLTMYALDGEAEHAVPLHSLGIAMQISLPNKGPVTVQLRPESNVLTGETEASTSQYSARSDDLKGVTEFSGVLPEMAFRGMELENVAVAYPGGGE